MQVQSINNSYNAGFGTKFKLSEETIKIIEKSTALSYEEMITLPLDEAGELMKKRVTLKKSNKIKAWLADKYKKFGEKAGLLKKQYNIYTDVD